MFYAVWVCVDGWMGKFRIRINEVRTSVRNGRLLVFTWLVV